jgi:hypothetical protein
MTTQVASTPGEPSWGRVVAQLSEGAASTLLMSSELWPAQVQAPDLPAWALQSAQVQMPEVVSTPALSAWGRRLSRRADSPSTPPVPQWLAPFDPTGAWHESATG